MNDDFNKVVREIQTNVTQISTKMDIVLHNQDAQSKRLSSLSTAVVTLEKDLVAERTHRQHAQAEVQTLIKWKDGFWTRVLGVSGAVAGLVSGIVGAILWLFNHTSKP